MRFIWGAASVAKDVRMLNSPLQRELALKRPASTADLFHADAPPLEIGRLPLALAIVIPTFNERDNVAPLLGSLDAALGRYRWEAIFVDDGSTDGTLDEIEAIARERSDVRLIRRVGRRGLASAIIEGMLSTIAPVIAVIDADMQHDETILPGLVGAIEEGRADIAIGTRYAAGGSTGAWDETRCRISAAGTRMAQVVVRREVSDPLSGFFAVRRSLLIEAAPKLSSVGFKVLLDLIASAPRDVRIAELPYRFRCRQAGTSKLDATVSIEFLLLLLDKLVGRYLPARLLMFLGVGAFGLVVNLAVLGAALDGAGWSFRAAEILAVCVAIGSNFTLNNMLTYRDRRLHGARWWTGLLSFAGVCGIGAIAQVGFATLLYGDVHNWWAAGIAGATIAAVWNYAATSFLTWKTR
jgi:dolichol-phosphate mannosyltransferase